MKLSLARMERETGSNRGQRRRTQVNMASRAWPRGSGLPSAPIGWAVVLYALSRAATPRSVRYFLPEMTLLLHDDSSEDDDEDDDGQPPLSAGRVHRGSVRTAARNQQPIPVKKAEQLKDSPPKISPGPGRAPSNWKRTMARYRVTSKARLYDEETREKIRMRHDALRALLCLPISQAHHLSTPTVSLQVNSNFCTPKRHWPSGERTGIARSDVPSLRSC